MRSTMNLRSLLLLLVIAVVAAACSTDGTTDTADTTPAPVDPTTESAGDDTADTTPATEAPAGDMDQPMDSAAICDPDGLVAAVEGGPSEGTLAGMADDPVGTAASNNPVLTTLVTAVSAAGLVDTLNSAPELTVFAPTDCAFAQLDPETLEAALADPQGLLTQVLGFHVIVGQRLQAEDLSGDYETFTGEMITVNGTDVDGQATVVVPNIMTANATVHLIDTVMIPG